MGVVVCVGRVSCLITTPAYAQLRCWVMCSLVPRVCTRVQEHGEMLLWKECPNGLCRQVLVLLSQRQEGEVDPAEVSCGCIEAVL